VRRVGAERENIVGMSKPEPKVRRLNKGGATHVKLALETGDIPVI